MPPPSRPPAPTRPDRIFSQSASQPTSAYARHLASASAAVALYHAPVPTPKKPRTERDILEEHHRFLRDAEEDAKLAPVDEERRLALKYDEKLFKEFAVVELARWRERMVAMRWRTKDEVIRGKGVTMCGALGCETDADEEEKGLKGFELNFEYVEEGRRKNALVKVRVCRECAKKLKYTQKERDGSEDERRRRKRREREKREKSTERERDRKREHRSRRSRPRTTSRSRSPRDSKRSSERDSRDRDKDDKRERRRRRSRSPSRSRSPRHGKTGEGRVARRSRPDEDSA